MANECIVPHDLAALKFNAAFRLFVGQGRRTSCVSLAAATGIGLRSIEAYQAGESVPSLHKFLAICQVLGAEFFCCAIEYTPFMVSDHAAENVKPQILLSSLTGLTASLAVKLEDGQINHVDKLELKSELRACLVQLSGVAQYLNGDPDD